MTKYGPECVWVGHSGKTFGAICDLSPVPLQHCFSALFARNHELFVLPQPSTIRFRGSS